MDVTAHLPNDPAVEIRAGVFRPDWSVVTKQRAREALAGRLAARAGLLDRWALRLEAIEDLIWRTILRLYADHGRPPTLADIAAASGITPGDLRNVLQTLRSHDLIDLDPHTGDLRLAYPFTQGATGHRVKIREHVLHSRCHNCGAPMRVETASEGKALKRHAERGVRLVRLFVRCQRRDLVLSGHRVLLLG
jgi:alkylmercury lyase